MTQQLIKVFGERNTGTRAIIEMIKATPQLTTRIAELRKPVELRDFKKKINDRMQGRWQKKYLQALENDNRARIGGVADWKHAAPRYDGSFGDTNAKVIFTVKNPYSWLISLAKKPYHTAGRKCLSMEQFIDYPWMTIDRDGINSVLASPMVLWNEKLRAYLEFERRSDVPVARLVFEDFVQDPVKCLSAAIEKLGADPTGVAEIARSTKDPMRSIEDIRADYRNETWRKSLTRQSVALINQYTDWEIAGAFGYAMLDPKDFPIEIAPFETERILNDLNKINRTLKNN